MLCGIVCRIQETFRFSRMTFSFEIRIRVDFTPLVEEIETLVEIKVLSKVREYSSSSRAIATRIFLTRGII